MKTIYRIERREMHKHKIISDIIGIDFISLELCNNKIRDYAEAWRKEANIIQHHAGESVVYFKTYYVEFTRLPSIRVQ